MGVPDDKELAACNSYVAIIYFVLHLHVYEYHICSIYSEHTLFFQDLVCASKRSTMSYILVPQLACKKEINLFI